MSKVTKYEVTVVFVVEATDAGDAAAFITKGCDQSIADLTTSIASVRKEA